MPRNPDILGGPALIAELAAAQELPRETVRGIFDQLASIVSVRLSHDHAVRLPGLGTLSAPLVAAHSARRPSDGQQVQVPARRRLRFRAAGALVAAVQPQEVAP